MSMKKLLPVILLFCLVVYMGGYHLIYALYKQGIRHDMRAWLSHHHDATFGNRFSFALSDNTVADPFFSWEETGAEFRYRGELYDVVSIHYGKDRISVCALKDGRENELDQQLSVLDHHKQEKQKTLSVLKFFSVFIAAGQTAFSGSMAVTVHRMPLGLYQLLHASPEINTPPPRC